MRDVSTRRLRYAFEVDRLRSFTAAAAALHLSQQGLSQQVRLLERDLGFALFDRTTRRVETTAAGALYLDAARRAVADLDRARSLARDHAAPRSTVRIGFLAGAAAELTDPVLDEFARRCPGVRVDLVEASLDDPTAGLRDEDIHAAFVRAPLDETGLELLQVFEEPRVVAMALEHPLAARDELRPTDLVDWGVLGLESPDETFNGFWRLEDALGDRAPTAVSTTTSIVQELQTISRGEAVSITAMAASRLMPWPNVAFRTLVGCAPSRLCLAWRTGDGRPVLDEFRQAVQAVVEREEQLVRRLAEAVPGRAV